MTNADLSANLDLPCRALAPTISLIADRYTGKVIVCKVNLDRAPVIAGLYGVRAIPTVLIIKDGKEIIRLVGLRPENEYTASLYRLIEKVKKAGIKVAGALGQEGARRRDVSKMSARNLEAGKHVFITETKQLTSVTICSVKKACVY